ncbi:MAG TPA: hypothetical protein VN716_18905 [Vicinamibacterales bacterium]|nr:hypothetical protein [Vicinamibacterales bacterium]
MTDWDEMLLGALRVGISIAEFWELCPADFDLIIAAWSWRQERELDRAYAGAWAAEIAARTALLEPSAKQFVERLTGRATPKAPPTAAELLAKFKWLHYMLGGR